MAAKQILVTGGNSGIGLALCRLLVKDHGCHVFLGSRNADKGSKAVEGIVSAHPEAEGKIEMVQLDVSDDTSVQSAAEHLKSKGASLYGLVNNAGVGLATKGDILNTNFLGPKRVTEAMVKLDLLSKGGRVVNVSSGAASAFVKTQDAATKELLSSPDTTWEELQAAVKACLDSGNVGWGNGYGLSKAALSSLTMIQAKNYPHLTCVSLSPGFIATNMTEGFGAKLTPEQGCVSSLKCLFGNVTSGHYYGSDGLRSPLTMTRDPGTPEYQGEPDPQHSTYNK